MKPQILLVDDEPTTLHFYGRHLRSLGYEAVEASSLARAREALKQHHFSAVLLDMFLPDGNGLDWIPELRAFCPSASIVVMTGAGDVSVAVEAMRRGADNFLSKPVNLDEVDVFIRKGLEISSLRRRDASHRRLAKRAEPYFGPSPEMQSVREMLTLAAENSAPVLFQGETGTGKGVLARWIHDRGPDASHAFVELNCSTLKGDLLASELFGHAKGSFTSAIRDRAGLIEVANGGTLFLDEIGDMDPGVQAQLLKVIEEKSYRRLGEVEVRRSEFRLICATNRDLSADVADGMFREDLFFRINVFPINLPPLAERRGDIPGLVQHLVGGSHPSLGEIPENVMNLLTSYAWPGNIRELKNVLERAMLLARGGPVEVKHFPGLKAISTPPSSRPGSLVLQSLEEMEQQYIREVLKQVEGDINRAGKILGISRATLYRKLKKGG